jgi:cytochrome P450
MSHVACYVCLYASGLPASRSNAGDEEVSNVDNQSKYELLTPQFLADPHPTFQRMRAEDPVYWDPRLRMWFLVRYDDIQRVARDPRFSAMRADHFGRDAPASVQEKLVEINRFLAGFLLFNDPPTHTRLRNLIGKAFSTQVTESLRPFIQQVVDDAIDAVQSRGRMDVIADLARPLPSAVIAKMLGIPGEDIHRFKGWTDDLFALVGSPVANEEIVAIGYRGVVGLKEYFRDNIALRRKQPSDDLLSLLVHAEDQGQLLDDEEIVGTCALLLVAGYETTTNLIGNGLMALFAHPDQMQLLRDDPELIDGAVEEFLRYKSAAFRLMRRAREDVELGGQMISAGQVVFGLLHAGNRDPAHFADPERLDITRKGNQHLGFGYGPHFCVGAPIARLETKIAINAMLQRLPELALPSQPLEWLPTTVIHGVRALHVTFAT